MHRILVTDQEGDSPRIGAQLSRVLSVTYGREYVTHLSIPSDGVDEQVLRSALDGCSIWLVVMGDEWQSYIVKRRQDEQHRSYPDLIEMTTLAASGDIALIGVSTQRTSHAHLLVGTAFSNQPTVMDWPVVVVRPGARFQADAQLLVDKLHEALEPDSRKYRLRWRLFLALGSLLVIAVLALLGPRVAHVAIELWNSSDSNHVNILVAKGDNLLAQSRPDEAIGIYQQAIQLQPDSHTAEQGLANAYLAVKNDVAALAHLDRVMELAPWKMQTRLERGWLNLRLQNDDKALADFRIVSTSGMSVTEAYRGIGLISYRRGAYDDAVEAYEIVYKADSRSRQALQSLAWSYFKLMKYDRSAYYFSQLLKYAPVEQNELALAISYDGLGALDAAVEHYRKYLDLAENPDAFAVKRFKELGGNSSH